MRRRGGLSTVAQFGPEVHLGSVVGGVEGEAGGEERVQAVAGDEADAGVGVQNLGAGLAAAVDALGQVDRVGVERLGAQLIF